MVTGEEREEEREEEGKALTSNSGSLEINRRNNDSIILTLSIDLVGEDKKVAWEPARLNY